MIPRFLGLLPFFVLGLHLKPRHLATSTTCGSRSRRCRCSSASASWRVYTDTWAETALLWYDTGYNEIPIDNEIVFQTRLTVMMVGLLGAFAAMSLVPRRDLGGSPRWARPRWSIYLLPRLRHQDGQGAGLARVHARSTRRWAWSLTVAGAVAWRCCWPAPPVAACSSRSPTRSAGWRARRNRAAQLRPPRRPDRGARHHVEIGRLVPGRARPAEVRGVPRGVLPRSAAGGADNRWSSSSCSVSRTPERRVHAVRSSPGRPTSARRR